MLGCVLQHSQQEAFGLLDSEQATLVQGACTLAAALVPWLINDLTAKH